MACKCLEEIPEALKKSCNEDKQFKSPVERIVIKGVKQSLCDNKGDLRLTAAMKIYTRDGKFPTTKPNFFTYCPFCGVRYTEDV